MRWAIDDEIWKSYTLSPLIPDGKVMSVVWSLATRIHEYQIFYWLCLLLLQSGRRYTNTLLDAETSVPPLDSCLWNAYVNSFNTLTFCAGWWTASPWELTFAAQINCTIRTPMWPVVGCDRRHQVGVISCCQWNECTLGTTGWTGIDVWHRCERMSSLMQ